jgi:hypothetical protein
MPESALSRLARSTELSKIRIAFRLSGAPSVLDGLTPTSESGCPRNFLTISFARNPVNLHIPQHLHMISTYAICPGAGDRGAQRASWKSGPFRAASAFTWRRALAPARPGRSEARNGMAFRFGSTTHRFLSARQSGRQKIEKRTCFGGPCFEGTLQKPTGVSESSPVAGTIENSAFSENLDAGRTREIQTNYDRLPHICSRWIVYTR